MFPSFFKLEMAPQKRKKSLTLSSEVSGDNPATWRGMMVSFVCYEWWEMRMGSRVRRKTCLN